MAARVKTDEVPNELDEHHRAAAAQVPPILDVVLIHSVDDVRVQERVQGLPRKEAVQDSLSMVELEEREEYL